MFERSKLMTRYSWMDYVLELYETPTTFTASETCRVAYRLYHDGDLIFQGDEFGPSPLYSVDGPEAASALLGFLAIAPSAMETDIEYFDGYTDQQLEFVEKHGNLLVFWSEVLDKTGRDYLVEQDDEFCTDRLVLPDDFEL